MRELTTASVIRCFDGDATWPGERGSTGDTRLGAREYNPQTGRFVYDEEQGGVAVRLAAELNGQARPKAP